MTAALLVAVGLAGFAPHAVDGELVAADFVHRAGRFRDAAGVAHDFALVPHAVVSRFGADADLRDVPLGTACRFTLYPDANGDFTRLAAMLDRTSEAQAGADAERQRQAHAAFLKARGLPGYVEKTAGKTLTVTLFGGDGAAFGKLWLKDIAAGRGVRVVVANQELRTWNPEVDQEYAKLVEVQKVADAGTGFAGVRLVLTVREMLEGFRRGRVVRVFADSWPSKDQPFGEQLFHYGSRPLPADLAELPPQEYPGQFPFRTDHGNAHLPWFRLKPGNVPPLYSEHAIWGELVTADAAKRTGRFLADRTGAAVEFTLTPGASVRSRGVDAKLADLPPGTRCRFGLYQDESGAFTVANAIADGASELAATGAVWRVTTLSLGEGKLTAASRRR